MQWIRLAIFIATFFLFIRFVSFDKFSIRGENLVRVFACLVAALLVVGAVDWICTDLFGWNLH